MIPKEHTKLMRHLEGANKNIDAALDHLEAVDMEGLDKLDAYILARAREDIQHTWTHARAIITLLRRATPDGGA